MVVRYRGVSSHSGWVVGWVVLGGVKMEQDPFLRVEENQSIVVGFEEEDVGEFMAADIELDAAEPVVSGGESWRYTVALQRQTASV